MTRTIRGIAAALAIALLAGCAGTNFKRPEPQDLVVGKSNAADIQRVMGSAQQTGEGLQNEQKVQTLRYAYAEGAGQGRYPGVVPARAMVFTTHNELLVAQEFVSSFQADATEFDESKVGAIVKGKTTRAEVLALLVAAGVLLNRVVMWQGRRPGSCCTWRSAMARCTASPRNTA